jgi:hypothetical protein
MLLVKFHSSGIFAGECAWKHHTLGCETCYVAILRVVQGIEFHYKLNVKWNNSTQNSTPESRTVSTDERLKFHSPTTHYETGRNSPTQFVISNTSKYNL